MSEDGAFEKYTPEQLKGFRFGSGEKYESLPLRNGRKFFKILATGKLDLLQLEEPGGITFYSRPQDSLPILLVYHEKLIENRYRHKNEYYKHQLKAQMSDVPALYAEIDAIKSYTEKALTNAFAKYNGAVQAKAVAVMREANDTTSRTTDPSPANNSRPASWSFGFFVGKAFSDPGFFSIGASAELESKSRVVFTSFNIQRGGARKQHQVPGHGSFASSHSMTQVGAKINFVIVPLTTVQPYASIVVNYVRYKNSINIYEKEPIRVSAIAMGAGLGVKFSMNTRVSFKTELEFHLIPGAEGLADESTIYLFDPNYEIANKPLCNLNAGLMFRLH